MEVTTMKPERGEEEERVIVVLEGFKTSKSERGVAPLHWAMRHIVRTDDKLLVLSILRCSSDGAATCGSSCFPFELPSSRGSAEDYHKWLQRQINERRQTYIRVLRPFYNACKIKGVKFQAKVIAGNQPLEIAIKEANDHDMTWMVMDKCLAAQWNLLTCYKNPKVAFVDNEETVEVYDPSSSGKETDPQTTEGNPEQEAPKPAWEMPMLEETCIRHASFPFTLPAMAREDVLSEDEQAIEAADGYTNFFSAGDLEPTNVLRQPVRIDWDEIVDATDGFRSENCVRRHGEIEVYDGCFSGNPVSVTRLSGDVGGAVENEKRVAMSLFHKNILGMLGYYYEGSSFCAFVYPPLARWTLDQCLFDGKMPSLPCLERMRIAIGIGQGLRYMHEECPGGPVAHGDLRPSNIVFQHGFQPLISGFCRAKWLQDEEMGLAESHERCCYGDNSDNSSVAMVVKSDIFSFGLLLLRLFCRKPLPENDIQLISWAQPFLYKGAFDVLVDQDMEDFDMYEMYKAMSAAFHCTNITPLCRPSMIKVISILKGERLCNMLTSPTSSINFRN